MAGEAGRLGLADEEQLEPEAMIDRLEYLRNWATDPSGL